MSAPDTVTIRPARLTDLPAITAIYAGHVRHGLASFEYDPPDVAEMTRRYDAIQSGGFPYFAAEKAGRVVGYAYVSPFRNRPGYRYTVENTVYVNPQETGHGIGYRLLLEVIEVAASAGYRQMIAVIGDTGNTASIRVHEKAGFHHAGTLTASGLKLGRWVDSVYMQRALGPGATTLPE